MTKTWRLCALAILAAALCAPAVSAQEEEGAPRRATAQPAAQNDREAAGESAPRDAAQPQPGQPRRDYGQAGRSDYFLATCLLIDNQAEASLAQFAQKRAESDEVRQFAEMMAQEHQQAAEMLTRLAQPQGSRDGAPRDDAATRDDAAPREEGARPATPRPEESVTARQAEIPGDRSGRVGGGMFFVSLKRELAEQCLQSAQKELGAKKGEEFDRCYIGSQVMAHQHMLDALTVFEKHAQGEELKNAIAQAKPTVQAHLDQAKAIAKKLEGKATGETAKTGAEKASAEKANDN